MSIQDLIDNGSIVFNQNPNDPNAMSSGNVAFTILALEALYGNPTSGTGSSSFRALFNDETELPLIIEYKADDAEAVPSSNTVRIDPSFSFLFADQNGTIQKADFQRLLAHEIHHALANDLDTTAILPKRRRHSVMAMSRPLLSLVAFPNPFSTTTPKSLWPVSLEIERVCGHGALQNCNHTTCSMTS